MADTTYFLTFDADGAATGSGVTPDGSLPPGAVACSQVQARDPTAWRFEGGQLAPAALGPRELMVYANYKQWGLVLGGYTVTIGGEALTFPTDPTSQTMIMGKAVRLAQPNPPVSINWQFASGFVTIAAADFMPAATAIADFVQATFDTLQAVEAGIQAGTIAAIADVDAAAWPANHA